MKKFLVLILAVILCFSLAGCTDDISSDSDIGGTDSKEEKELGVGSAVKLDKLKFTAADCKISTGESLFMPADGKVFVGIKFVIENISKEDQSVSTLLYFEGYVDDVKCDYSINAACVFDEGTLDGSIAAGKKLEGWYALEVPKDWKTIEITVQEDIFGTDEQTFVFRNENIGQYEADKSEEKNQDNADEVENKDEIEEEFKNLKFIALDCYESQGDEWFAPEEGNVFVGVKFLVENISNEEQSVSSLLYFEGYVDDVKCDYSFNAACAFDEGTLDGSIAAGKKLEGWYALEVPKDWKKIEIVVREDIFSNAKQVFEFENK